MHLDYNAVQTVEAARQRVLVEQQAVKGPLGPVSDYIIESWDRCRRSGMDFSRDIDFELVSANQLRQLLDRDMLLLRVAQSELDILGRALGDSGHVVILTDDQGVVVSVSGDVARCGSKLSTAARRGVDLSETKVGTNALGTALIEGRSVFVRGAEHYFVGNRDISCVSTPLFSPTGQLMGVLDISTEGRALGPGLKDGVRSSALRIEKFMLSQLRGVRCLGIHPHPGCLGSPFEGLIALDGDDQITGLNSTAARLIGIRHAEVVGRRLEDFFGLSRNQANRALDRGEVFNLEMQSGLRLSARLHESAGSRAVVGRNADDGGIKREKRSTKRDAAHSADVRIEEAFSRALRAYNLGLPVLVTGESGTGKEVFTRSLHEESRRCKGPFIPVNCAAIPESLIESELFGYRDGAFTGARRGGCAGRIEQAQGGTLFLDEIGDMPAALQARLLRVLQDQVVYRLGDSYPIPVDFSLICATHCDLEAKVAARSFRMDLFYRIRGLCVTLPPLRERSDILAIAESILRTEGAATGVSVQLAPDAAQLILSHSWPGNIRQLRSALISTIAGMDEGETEIGARHLADALSVRSSAAQLDPAMADQIPALTSLADAQRQLIAETLKSCGNNVSEAARRLGVARGTIYRYLGQAGSSRKAD